MRAGLVVPRQPALDARVLLRPHHVVPEQHRDAFLHLGFGPGPVLEPDAELAARWVFRVVTRKVYIEKISTWGNSKKFIGNITYLVCFLMIEGKIFVHHAEIRKAGVMIQLPTIHYLNTY